MNTTYSDNTTMSSNTTDGNARNSSGGFGSGQFRGKYAYDDLGPTTRISVWILVALSFVFLFLRLYCKFARHRRFHADDYFAGAAWVSWTCSDSMVDSWDNDVNNPHR